MALLTTASLPSQCQLSSCYSLLRVSNYGDVLLHGSSNSKRFARSLRKNSNCVCLASAQPLQTSNSEGSIARKGQCCHGILAKELQTGLSAFALSSLLLLTPPQVDAAPALEQSSDLCGVPRAVERAMPIADVASNNAPAGAMTGMSTPDFDPMRYVGRWYEVASLKKGFSGQGQEDCHCTQGVYTYDGSRNAIDVDTFCVHGGPGGYITGIRGNVSCVPPADLMRLESDFERAEMIREKCFLRFPSIPFVPKLPYDVIATDYDNFALVSGARDTSFIQVYSRTPNPGRGFIEEKKEMLGRLGYDVKGIKDTPQDCPVIPSEDLSKMMAAPGSGDAMTNRLPVSLNKLPIDEDKAVEPSLFSQLVRRAASALKP